MTRNVPARYRSGELQRLRARLADAEADLAGYHVEVDIDSPTVESAKREQDSIDLDLATKTERVANLRRQVDEMAALAGEEGTS